MRYDDEKYLSDEDDNDLWDDELELVSDDSHTSYSPYLSDDDAGNDGAYNDNGVDNNDTADNGNEDSEPDYYSDPEPETPRQSRRERLFGKKKDTEEEEEENDYFDSDTEPTPPPKKANGPKLDPEDPDYWISDEEESPLSGIMPKADSKWKWKAAVMTAIIIMLCGAWIWFLRPYSDNAVKYGYIKNMERRGSFIKTFEGTMIPYKELGDPNPFYFEEVRFSVVSDSLAAHMKRMMLGCIPVRVEYETYHAPLPWKGEEKMIIVRADTADPRKILPPEYRH